MKTTLLIMAAGIGSRFGGGIKQLEPVDNNNHIIMDYSIHDARFVHVQRALCRGFLQLVSTVGSAQAERRTEDLRPW